MTKYFRALILVASACCMPGILWATNPPDEENCENSSSYRAAHPEECENCNSGSSNSSLGYFISFGSVPFEEDIPAGRIVIHQNKPTPTIFTPQSVRYESVLGIEVTERRISAADWEFRLVNEKRRSLLFRVTAGTSVGVPVEDSVGASYSVTMLNPLGATVVAGVGNPAPAALRLNFRDGRQVIIDYVTGRPTHFKSSSGRTIELATLPAEVKTDLILVDSVVRQVKAAEGLADFVQVADQKFEIRLYTRSQIGVKNSSSGLYELTGFPYRVIAVENASSNTINFSSMKITETWGSRTKVDQFDYNEAVDEWQLAIGSGELRRVESKSITPGPGSNETTITRTLKNSSNVIVSKLLEVKRNFAWASAIVSRTQEPDTLNLTITYDYYTTSGQPGYSKLKSKVFPDGYWETYAYDAQGRKIQIVKPWKDAAFSQAVTGPRVVVTYSYSPLESGDMVSDEDERPRSVTESIVTEANGNPVVTKRTFFVFKKDTSGIYTQIEEQAASATASYGAAGNRRITRVYYTVDSGATDYDAAGSGRVRYEDRPDGTRTAYTYVRNVVDLNSYWTVSEVIGTPASPAGVEGLSTRTDTIYDVRGNLVETKRYVRASNAWQYVSSETRTTNEQGMHVASFESGRKTFGAVYNGRLLESRTDKQGVTVTYTYDDLEKVESETKQGVPASGDYAAQPNITKTYFRELGGLDCGCDGEVITITNAGPLSLQTLHKKDKIGRPSYEKDAAGLETTHTYTLGGRESTRTDPDGSTATTLNYRDRRPASITGTNVIAEYYDYGVNSDGTTWRKRSLVAPGGGRWEKKTLNHLDQVVKEERPAFDGGVITTTHIYNGKGQLERTHQSHFIGSIETPIVADTIRKYDEIGNPFRSGLDVNGNGSLDLASDDRITDTVTSFAQHESAWWRVVQTKVYPTLNSSSAIQVTESRQRLSGLSTSLAKETVAIDIDGNSNRQRVEVDLANRLMIATKNYATSSVAEVRVSRNGLLVSQNTKSIASPRLFGYDELGRLVSEREPRHQHSSLRVYDAISGQVIGQTDAAGNTTTLEYYPNGVAGAGRVKLVTDAAGNTRRTSYDLLGRVEREWGTVTYPKAYAYSDYGELNALRTWRNTDGVNLDSATWPVPAGGDLTSWVYQPSTGLLTRKQYADGKGTDYTYDKAGRARIRTWARGVSTTYDYSPATGELLSVDYSDSTPDVTSTYDRLGRPLAVTDATGTRSFAYLPASLRLDTEMLSTGFFGPRVLKRDYQTPVPGEVAGRFAGYRLGTVAEPDQDFAVSYAYDNSGRVDSVSSPAGIFSYTYVADSDLLYTTSSPVHITTRSYEPDRDLITWLENKVGASVTSRFDYANNVIGQRSERTQRGTAFAAISTDVFSHNSRGELDGATNSSLASRDESFTYDSIGNRLSSTTSLGTTGYTSNLLNQYTQVSAPFVSTISSPEFDLDGNQITSGLGQSYSWDAENRLISVQPIIPINGNKKVHNTYDSQSRRVRRQVFTFSAGTWYLTSDEKFIYANWSPIAVLSWNSSTSNFDLKEGLTWGLDLSGALQGAGGVGGLLAIQDASSVHRYTYDGNGNVSELLDPAGAVSAHYEYTPFGGTFVASGVRAAGNEYRFSTKPLDEVSGLYYYGYRYYNPSVGRWLSRDPIEERDGPNIYAFVRNCVLNTTDFLGLACCGGQSYNPDIGLSCCGTATSGMTFNSLTEQCCSAQNVYYKVPNFSSGSAPFNGAPCCGPAGYAWQYLPIWRGNYSSQSECEADILSASWLQGGASDAASVATSLLGLGASQTAGLLAGLAGPVGNQVARQIAQSFCSRLTCQNPAGGL